MYVCLCVDAYVCMYARTYLCAYVSMRPVASTGARVCVIMYIR